MTEQETLGATACAPSPSVIATDMRDFADFLDRMAERNFLALNIEGQRTLATALRAWANALRTDSATAEATNESPPAHQPDTSEGEQDD